MCFATFARHGRLGYVQTDCQPCNVCFEVSSILFATGHNELCFGLTCVQIERQASRHLHRIFVDSVTCWTCQADCIFHSIVDLSSRLHLPQHLGAVASSNCKLQLTQWHTKFVTKLRGMTLATFCQTSQQQQQGRPSMACDTIASMA